MVDVATIPSSSYEGTRGDDVIEADRDLDSIDNLITTFGGKDWIDAGEGNDIVFAGLGHDIAYGGAGHDYVYGEDGHDTLGGNAGNDHVSGGRGHDVLYGDEGDDTLDGGAGHDTLTGGANEDVFYFESGFGMDVVTDFRPGQDVLAIKANINGLDVSSPEDLAAYVKSDGGNAVIKLHGDTITLVGISREDLVEHLSSYVKIV